MDTALYYTLSTIAQTLAGALAILVAVVVFKLASLAREQEVAADTLRANSIDPDVYLPIARKQGYGAMVEEVRARTGWEIGDHQGVRRACVAAAAAYREWGHINLRLYPALAATVVDIAVCLVALPYVPALVERGWATHVVWGAVGLSMVCLLLYVWLILTMVRR